MGEILWAGGDRDGAWDPNGGHVYVLPVRKLRSDERMAAIARGARCHHRGDVRHNSAGCRNWFLRSSCADPEGRKSVVRRMLTHAKEDKKKREERRDEERKKEEKKEEKHRGHGCAHSLFRK